LGKPTVPLIAESAARKRNFAMYYGDGRFLTHLSWNLFVLDVLYLLMFSTRTIRNGVSVVEKRFRTKPKHQLAILTHIVSGTIVIVWGAVNFQLSFWNVRENFANTCYLMGIVMISSSFVHVITICALFVKIRGERRITVPAYVAAVFLNAVTTVALLSDPAEYILQRHIWFTFNSFVFVRLLYIMYHFCTSMDDEVAYTTAVVLSVVPTAMTILHDHLLFMFLFILLFGGPFMEHVLDNTLGLRTVPLPISLEDGASGKKLSRERGESDSISKPSNTQKPLNMKNSTLAQV